MAENKNKKPEELQEEQLNEVDGGDRYTAWGHDKNRFL